MLKPKMVTCTCGNTDLQRVGVKLHLTSEDGKSLPLIALLCRGDGCGRVTFRPQETPKTEGEQPAIKHSHDHQLAEAANFAEGARVVEGARLVGGDKFAEGAKLVEGARLVESPRSAESARFVEGARVIESPIRPDTNNGKTNGNSAKADSPKRVAALFERVYTERLVYKAIAERDPNCPRLFEALKENQQVCSGISQAFGQVYQRIEADEDLLTALQSLPSIAGQG